MGSELMELGLMVERVMEVMGRLQARLDHLEIARKEILTAEEAMALLGISREHLKRLRLTKQIPYYTQGKQSYYRREQLLAWQTKHYHPTLEELQESALEATEQRKWRERTLGARGNRKSESAVNRQE